MNKKNNLDEMQEQQLLHIESRGCWFCFWGLLVSMGVQMLIYNVEECAKMLAGEWIVFMCLCVYLCLGCMKNGIWDRRLKPNAKVNVVVSIITAVIVGAFWTILKLKDYADKSIACVGIGVFMAVVTFVLVLISLEITRAFYKKRVKKLESEPEDDEE